MSLPLDNSIAQERLGYPKAKACLAKASTPDLQREYLQGNKDRLCQIFGGQARRMQRLVAEELLSRGETTIPNPFGPITVKP